MKDELYLETEIWLEYIAFAMCFIGILFGLMIVIGMVHGKLLEILSLACIAFGIYLKKGPTHWPIRTWTGDLEMNLLSLPRTEAERASIASWAKLQLEDAGVRSRKAIQERTKEESALQDLEKRSFPEQNPEQLVARKMAVKKELAKARRSVKRTTKRADVETKRYLRIWDFFTKGRILTPRKLEMCANPTLFRARIKERSSPAIA
jgi:hypothetical protein